MVEIKDKPRPRVIGVCAARGGSTRLPNKNMRLFAGRPLIAWTCIQANCSLTLDEFWVSTDDEGIAEIAKKYGARVKMREHEGDSVPGYVPVVNLIKEVAHPDDLIVSLMATNPLRKVDDIDRAVKQFYETPGYENKIMLALSKIWEDSVYEWVSDDYVQVKSSYDQHSQTYRHSGLILVSTRKYYEAEVPNEKLGDRLIKIVPYEVEPWQVFETDLVDGMRLTELIFYDQILAKSLNPYASYRKGGLNA